MSKTKVKSYNQMIEAMRAQVTEVELRARYAKANWETMHYTLEGEKLKPAYAEYVESERQKQIAAQEDLNAQEEKLNELLEKIDKTPVEVSEETVQISIPKELAPTDAEGAE